MGQFPFIYERIEETTWAYMSSLLMLALFFKFNRFWSFRNFDLLLIILLAPGILMVEGGRQLAIRDAVKFASITPTLDVAGANPDSPASSAEAGDGGDNPQLQEPTDPVNPDTEGLNAEPAEPPVNLDTRGARLQRWGYYWLFCVSALFLVRMLFDPLLVRRPLLDPNLAIGGLVFMVCSLMIFLFVNIITAQPTEDDVAGAAGAMKMLKRESSEPADFDQLRKRGPGYAIFHLVPVIPTFSDQTFSDRGGPQRSDSSEQRDVYRGFIAAAKWMAIVSQLFIVLGLVLIGYRHFNNLFGGVGMATIYLMLPYTAVFTGYVLHALPAALIVWAILVFRRPLLSGILIGLASGVSYYPLFLLPLWISFYWEKGARPFIVGMVISFVFCAAGLIFTSSDLEMFLIQLQAMFGFMVPRFEGLEGVWALGWDPWFRLPFLVAFIALSVSFVFWPTQKNIGTLVSYSCALMIAVQFWLGFDGGLVMAWYLPLALLVIFRPNVEGRVALSELTLPAERLKPILDESPPV